MDLDDIKAIIDLMKQNDLAVFKLEREGFKLELEAQRPIAPVMAAVPAGIATQTLPANVTGSSGAAGEEKSKLKEIVSQQIDGANVAAHLVGDQISNLVELVLRGAALRHDSVETR